MNKLLAQTLIATAGIIRGTLASAFSYLNTLIKSGTDSAMQFHQEGIAFAREMGMNAKEAQAYTEVLTDRTEKLAMKYGVAAEQVKELQRNISIATSRQLMLNESQAEGFLQLNKLVGSSTVTKFTEQMMNGMGGQLDTVQGAVSKAYATAAKSGLNAQKVSEKIANNLNMANKLSFRTGIEGLTRMAMQAEKVGLSLNSVESAANAFMEIDDAIQASAKLNMLGGQFAMLGGNPLDMAYEANADPEAFQKRLIGMAQGAAKFDAQKGIATVDPMMMDMLRNAAKAMNLNPDELVGSAKKQASNAYKESNINFGAFGNLTKEQRDFLINKSDVAKGGNVKFTTTDNKVVDLSNPSNVNQEDFKKVLDEMMKYEGMSDHDIMAENAKSLSSINEILTGIKESITAMFAKFIEGIFPQFQGDLKNFGAWAKDSLLPVAKNIGEGVRGVYDWFKENKEGFKTLANSLFGFIKFITSKWEWLVAYLVGGKLWKMLNNSSMIGRGASRASGAAATPTSIWGKARQAYQGVRAHSGMAGGTKWNGIKAAAKAGGKALLKTGGASLVGGLVGWAGNAAADSMAEKGTIEKGGTAHTALKAASTAAEYAALGATVGSIIPGIGTAAGATVGGIAGAIKGFFDTQKAVNEESGVNIAVDNTNSGARAVQTVPHDEGGFIEGITKTGFVKKGIKGAEAPIEKIREDTAYKEEVVLNPIQQQRFMAIANGETPVKPKNSLGEAEYIYKPNRTETSNVNGNTVTVKDFNININGTLRLEAGNYSKSVNGRDLLNDYQFMTQIKNMIRESINRDINGGMLNNDLATVNGYPAQTSMYGKIKH